MSTENKDNKSTKFEQTSTGSSADGNYDIEKDNRKEEEAINFVSERTKPFVALVACAAALGGLIFGYDIVSSQSLQYKVLEMSSLLH